MTNVMSREMILKSYVEEIRYYYDYVLIDCMPSLGMLTINALAAADSVVIPVQTSYLPVKGLEQLLSTISKVRRQLNRGLHIEGILLTIVDLRTNYAKTGEYTGKGVFTIVEESYGLGSQKGRGRLKSGKGWIALDYAERI